MRHIRPPRRLRLLVSVTTLACVAAPAAARAAIAWAPCESPAGYQCATLPVPLDRSGTTPGTVMLKARRVPASANPTGEAVVALVGGPGQAALPIAPDLASVLGPALGARDFLVFDARGTGLSSPLRCNALSRGAFSLEAIGRDCANEIGPARGFYRTVDSVEDLEALRVASGYTRLVIYGVSYGTKVALAYAARYAANVSALVLDSVVTPEGPDPLRRASLQAVPRVVRELCEHRACTRATPSAVRDLGTLARRLSRRDLRGKVVDSRGRRRSETLTQTDLFRILLAGDLNPTLRAELPGSVRSALRGDTTPLLRLSVRSAGLENAADGEGDNDAVFLATTCEEAPFPWTRGAPVRQRTAEAAAAVRALPSGATGPFSRSVALTGGPLPLCLGWPTVSPAPAPPGPLPTVPTLIFDGKADLRTPLEDARGVAARIPGAQVIAVPHTGHSVLGNDLSRCSQDAVTAFFAAQPVAACPATPNPFSPSPRPPTSVARLQPTSGVAGLAGRTLTALRMTVTDARRQVIGESIAAGRDPLRVGGLRAGYASVVPTGLRFRAMAYVPGVEISGFHPDRGTSTFRVGGPRAARGSVRITQTGVVSGTLGGQRVRAAFSAGAAAFR